MPYMKGMVPLPGIYDPDYIAANQDQRADSLIKGSKHEQMETVREQIREFKQSTGVDKVSREWLCGCDEHSCLVAAFLGFRLQCTADCQHGQQQGVGTLGKQNGVWLAGCQKFPS